MNSAQAGPISAARATPCGRLQEEVDFLGRQVGDERPALAGAATAMRYRVRGRTPAALVWGAATTELMRHAVLPLATDEVRVDVRTPSRSAVFRYGQPVSAVERVFTRHNPLVSKPLRRPR